MSNKALNKRVSTSNAIVDTESDDDKIKASSGENEELARQLSNQNPYDSKFVTKEYFF
jgi:hypothetical protein